MINNIKNLVNMKNISRLPLNLYPKSIKRKIRSSAVKKVTKILIQKGKSCTDIPIDEYEYLVEEEQTKIWQLIKNRSVNIALLVIFGTTF